jgi:ion channel
MPSCRGPSAVSGGVVAQRAAHPPSLSPMSDSADLDPDARRQASPPSGVIARAFLRALASTIALVVIYYLLPLNRSSTAVAVTMLVIGLAVFLGLVAFQVRAIVRSPFPGLRAGEALATSVPLFLLLFAATYVVLATISASNFSQPLSRTDAIYFTVTVFATVGFGDITAKTEAARLVVTGQMITDLIIIGVGVRIIVGAVTRGRQRRSTDAGTGPPGR